MEIVYTNYDIFKTIRILSRSQRYKKCGKFFVIFVIVCWCVNIGNCAQHEQHQQYSYGGHFIGEDEAEAMIAIESSIRLAKIPCNFTTKTNCLYAEKFKLNSPFKENNEIVVSWVPPHGGALNTSDYHKKNENDGNVHINTNASENNNILQKSERNVYNFNWIFELLACMMLASVFEICLLILRNLRNISLTLFGFWSTLYIRLQMLCFYNADSTSPINKNDNMRKRNVAMGEKRTLSYIFAILTWRASQTAKDSVANTEANLRDDSTNSSISYGHVTSMGDLLLLILFTHVYYQRQKFQQGTGDNNINTDPEDLLEGNKGQDQNTAAYRKLYDKQSSSNIFNDSNRCKRNMNKRCSHFCGNMYQQILSLQEYKTVHGKLSPLTNYTTKIPYFTYCTGIVWYTCCLCQYSYRSCCYCFGTCRRWNQRCYIYMPPICNTIYCCCFYKSLKLFHDVNYQYCCYLCCWQDFCHINYLGSHKMCQCCCCFYCERLNNHCYLCNTLVTNKIVVPSKALLSCLLNTIEGFTANKSSTSEYCRWKLTYNNQKYYIIYDINGQKYSLIYLADGRPMCVNNRNYYKIAVDVFSSFMPEYLVTLKNYQTLLKWKKLHVTVLIMALIVICASSSGANYDHHHRYYCSLFNKYHKHFCKCKQNKRRRRRRRRRVQHCKAYRPQHYFCATLMSCVARRQHKKRLHKKIITKFCTKSTKLMTSNTTANYEYLLASTASTTPMRNPIVRAVRRVRGSKPNIVWLIIGLIWFEGPKIVSCNVIINYQNQQQHEQQHQQQQQQQSGSNHKETTTATNSVNSNFEYKLENFNQMKTKNNNNSSTNNNRNKSKSSNNNNNSNAGNNRSSTTNSNNNHNDIQLSVNLIPIFNSIHFKQYCNSNYHKKFIRSSQRFQRALKVYPNNLDTSITPSASLKHNSFNDDLGSEHFSSSGFQNFNDENHAQSDLMRLESIKHQILFKLGLTRKPNVSHPLPKQFIWDTIYRADGIRSFHDFSNPNNFHGNEQFVSSHRSSSPYFSAGPNIKSANTEPINHQQRLYRHKNKEGLDNIKRSLESVNTGRKKYSKNIQNQRQTLTKHYNNNDVSYQKGGTTSTNLNQLLYTSNRNKSNHTNKMVNNFTILKQSKHQQIHQNSQHSTTGKKTTTTHQQQNRRQNIQYTNKLTNSINFKNNKIITINKNNINNNGNNVNNSNNNIIVVQKQFHSTNNSNKYSDEEKKVTYLTDVNSDSDDDDNLNNMQESRNHLNFDDNNSLVRNQQKQHNIFLNEKVSENDKHFINIENDDTDDGNSVNFDINTDHNVFPDEGDGINEEDDYNNYNQNPRNGNRFQKFENFEENDDFFGSTQEIITFAEKGKMYKNHRLVEFSHQNNENPKQKLHVRNAEIHIRIDKISIRNKSRAGSGIKRKRLKIWIFQLIEHNYTYKGFDHVAQFCASFDVDTSRLGWKKFDITSTVKEWYSRREGEKLRLLIDCTGCGKMYTVHLFNSNNVKAGISIRERRIADEARYKTITNIQSNHFYNVTTTNENQHLPYNQTIVVKHKADSASKNSKINSKSKEEDDLLNSNRPFLVLHTEARKQRRVRRRAINCNGALHGQCCKESFYVSFKALGWDDWIIAPRGYFANYCRGDCTGPYRTPDTFQTFHAHFIEEYRKMGLLNGMQPCCAPIKFSSMSLIYYGDEGIIKRDLPKMVVDECGCP